MNTTQKIYTVLGGIIVVLFAYIVITQPKVKAGNEVLDIQKRIIELDELEQQAKDNRHLAEENKAECVESWNSQQRKESDLAEGYRQEKKELEERLVFLLNR